MSDTVDLGRGVYFPARSATLRTVFRHLHRHAVTHEDIREMLEREDEFDAIGGWRLGSLSVPSLHVLANELEVMAADPMTAASNWNPERRPIFVNDIQRFRERLAERLALPS